RKDTQLPPLPADAGERQSARLLRHAGTVRGCGAEPADLRGERPGALQGHRHHAYGAQLRPMSALRGAHVSRRRENAGSVALTNGVRRRIAAEMSSAEPTVTRIDDVQVVGERINALIDASASGGVVARERAEELVRLVADLYGAGL